MARESKLSPKSTVSPKATVVGRLIVHFAIGIYDSRLVRSRRIILDVKREPAIGVQFHGPIASFRRPA